MSQAWIHRYRVTIMMSAVALAAHAIPSLTQWLQLDFAAVQEGQWWRIGSGHVTHYDGNHLFWDLLMFATLGAACERRHPEIFWLALMLMMAGISAAIGILCDQITAYRGLSGIDTGLFVWLAVDQIRQSLRERDRLVMMMWLVPCAGLMGKLLFEALTGQTLFVDSSNFRPLVESHLAGACIGLLLGGVTVPGKNKIPDELASPPSTLSFGFDACLEKPIRLPKKQVLTKRQPVGGNRQGLGSQRSVKIDSRRTVTIPPGESPCPVRFTVLPHASLLPRVLPA